ncbi:hypothetical protein EDB83DRAFT_2317680 [Lactarius deliciosus]|nr:hypothetical protein EDB83DRAFT_2317680 [Lactarius deliciosus]
MSQPSAPSSSSKTPATTPSTSNFKVIFEKALKEYNKKTKQDLTAHPLATRLQACDSPAAILTILQEQVDQFKQSRSADERLHKWLDPTINVLYAFSQTLGEGVGLVFSPAKAIFAGAGVLLLAAKEVEASQEILIDIFERIENFFRRLEIHTKVPPTPAMTDMMVKIMVKVLDILGTATQEMKQSRARKFLKKMAGMGKLEGDLKKLDKMTTEEARMASAETLKITHDIDKKVDGVDEKVQGVRAGVKDVDEKVQGVDEKVQTIIDDGKEAATEAKLIMQRAVYKLDEVERRQLRESLRDWQSPPDPSTNHVIASDCQHERTTEWFCKGNIFEEWKATGSLLWIHGKPGSGKSILCSAVINNIETLHKAGLAHMAYFYFDFREVAKQSRRDLLRSLLIQLSARSDSFCDILSRLYKEHDDGTRQPTDSALMYCLKEMLTLPNQSPVYLIMDALDECPNTSGIPSARQQVLDLVMELVCLRLSSLRICATSRPEVDIRYAIEPLAFCSISIHEEVGQEKDIIEYIKSVVYSPSNTIMKQWRDEQKDMVVQTLSERADGMFRWVFCQLETLRHCLPQNVSHILRQLPATLDETYARVLKEIGKTNQNYAHRLLQCLTVTKRPLRVEELAEILALDFSAEEGIPELKENWRWKDQQEAVLSICSSLISVVGDSDHRVVQFSHFSVQEFLTSDRLANSSVDISCFHILPEPAHTVVVKASLGVLLQLRVDDAQTGHRSPLAKYAAKHWADHARFENVWTRVEDGIRRLFDSAKPHFEVWCGLIYRQLHPLQFFHYYDSNKNHGSPLYYASLCGLYDLAAHLVAENPQFLTGLVDRNPSPLVAALRNKHFDIAELLYQRGIDLGIRDDNNQTLLHAASVGGYVDTAKWLFEHGVPSKSQQRNHETPLYPTEVNGHEGYGVTVDAADDADRTPLHWASQGGYSDIARELVMRGAGVATKDQSFRTPLHLASYSGSAETVRLLIEHGADVALQDREHKTPLHLASGFLVSTRLRLY